MNDQHMYDLSTPTHPDHLADITAGMRKPHSPTSEYALARTFDDVDHDIWEAEGGAIDPTREFNDAIDTITVKPSLADAMVALVEPDAPVRPERLKGPRIDPYGDAFMWGPIVEVHQVGPYTILEYLDDRSNAMRSTEWVKHGRTLYHVFVDGKNSYVAALSLDAALAGAIAYRRDGEDSRAGDYFMRMVGGGD